jgi:hypothetical protein
MFYNDLDSVAYPGCLYRIMVFIHPGSRISDPGSKKSNTSSKAIKQTKNYHGMLWYCTIPVRYRVVNFHTISSFKKIIFSLRFKKRSFDNIGRWDLLTSDRSTIDILSWKFLLPILMYRNFHVKIQLFVIRIRMNMQLVWIPGYGSGSGSALR